MMNISTSRIADLPTRSAIEAIQAAWKGSDINSGNYRHFEIITTGAVTDLIIFHNLGFVPEDILETKVVGGTVIWNWGDFTKENLSLTTSAAVTIRCYIGRND